MKNVIVKRAIIIAVILLALFGTAATLYTNNLTEKLYTETDGYLKDITIQTAKAIKNRINENLTQLNTISLMIQQEGFSQDTLLGYLDQLAQRDGVKRFGISDLEGNTVTSDHKSFNISDRKYFKDSLEGKVVTSKSIIDYIDNEAINVYSVPIYKYGEITGVLFATFYTDKLFSTLSLTSYNKEGYSFLFDKMGDIILSGKGDRKSIATAAIDGIDLNNIDVEGTGILSFKDENDTLNYLIYANIENTDWLVASVFPKEEVTKEFQKIIQSAFATWIVIGIGSAVLIAYFCFKQDKNKMQISKLAYEDEVTKHYNYYRFIEYCKEINHLSDYILVNCDIKGFKWFNEIYGEDIANDLLKRVMICIEDICEDDEFCCRQSSDHFVLLLHKAKDEQVNQRLLGLAAYIREEFAKSHATLPYYFHFGIYEIVKDNIDINVAFKKTQYAGKDLKHLSKDNVTFYQEEVFQKELYSLQIEKEFQNSINKNYFKAYIQPKVNLKTGKVSSGEILTRWYHPKYGVVSPDEFIPIYEKNGMLGVLDLYIIKKSLEAISTWKNIYGASINISINVSKTYIFNNGYVEKLVQLIKFYHIDPQQVEIEITETTIVNHKEELIGVLNKLKAYNFRIALDDFGSGYSSLNMLKDLPIDVVKIDREFFIIGDCSNKRSYIIIEEMIELCHKLNFEVVAEGVETLEQRDFLKAHNCDYIQGYYYYCPMSLEEFEKLFVNKEKE